MQQTLHRPKRIDGTWERLYSSDEGVFDKCTPDAAYWLGFLATDGALIKKDYAIQLMLQQRDVQSLEDFRSFLKADNPIKTRVIEGGNYSQFVVYSPRIYSSLIKRGITPNKSLTIGEVKIDKEYANHFVRGAFDGDGSLYSKGRRTHVQWMICGASPPFLQQIKDFIINSVDVSDVRFYCYKNNVNRLQWTGLTQVLNILGWLYKDSTEQSRLDRKYQQYVKLKAQYA